MKAPLLFAGFSQGVSMAFRAAINSTALPAAVVAVGGDVSPEIAAMLKRLLGAMLCRGVSDPVYSNEKFREDEGRLIGAGVNARVSDVRRTHVAAGTGWNPAGLCARVLPRFNSRLTRVTWPDDWKHLVG